MPNLDQAKSITQPLHDKLASITAAIQDVVNIIDTDIMPVVGDVANALSNVETTVASWLGSKDALAATANASIATLQTTIDDLKAKLAAITPAGTEPSVPVVPPPAPVVTPSSIPSGGFAIVLQNMTEIQPGVFRSTNLGATKAAGGQVAVVQARLHTPAQPGQTVVVKYDQTTNVVKDGTKNIKDFRAWPSPSTPYPNDYTGRTLGAGDDSITAENNDGMVLYHGSSPAKWNVAYFHMPIKADVKQHIERTIRFSSAPGKPDGYAKIVVDNLLVFEADGFVANGPREDFGPQMVYAPLAGDSGPLPAGAYLQIENLSVAVL